VFNQAEWFTHLFDLRTGSAQQLWSSVSVVAKTATQADSLSTAFSILSSEWVRQIAAVLDSVDVFVTNDEDRMRAL
jgi:thiamine biosynthesis lipoprotein